MHHHRFRPAESGSELTDLIEYKLPGGRLGGRAMGQQAMVIEAIQAGARDFIVKPFQADRVLEAVRKAVG